MMAAMRGCGWTALHDTVFAAHGGDTEVIPVLLAAGADLNAPAGCGQTPLIAAASFGRLEAVRVLLAHGADATRRDETGQTAVFMAHGNEEIRRLLEEAMLRT